MRCNATKIGLGGEFLDHTPDHLLRDARAPDCARPVYAPEEPAVVNLCRRGPAIDDLLDPAGNGNAPDVTAFALEVENDRHSARTSATSLDRH